MKIFHINTIKCRKLYTTKEAAKELNCCEASIHRMVKIGLPVLDKDSRPFLIMGSDLFAYLKKKNQKHKVILKPDEMLCVKCKKGVKNGKVQ